MGSNKLTDENRLSIVRPDLIKYFINPKDADNLSQFSHKRALLKCPDCGCEKQPIIFNFTRTGFSCPECSDGISVPTKFILGVLQQLNVDFVREKVFDWAKDKKYDFYIPSMNLIIEAHGIQHYDKGFESCGGMSLKNTIINDDTKRKLAKENDVLTYIEIDLRQSDYDFMRNNTIETLVNYFDFSKIEWEVIFINCSKSLIVESWELYNKNIPPKTIIKMLGISHHTLWTYLTKGNASNVINYDPMKIRKDTALKLKNYTIRKIGQYDLVGNIIRTFDSMTEAQNITGIQSSNICKCCKGTLRQTGGFKWEYLEEKYKKSSNIEQKERNKCKAKL